ncbi:hypothetical protein LCGC14_2730840 [marine sediment metagenome]|uniref:Uncharacterized protein n=1 Tax=marine sediment metagenome TaxID=412755 RepID=A0A0F9BGB7_9ZZZZ
MSSFTFSGDWFSEYYPNISGKVSIDLPYEYGEFDTELQLTYSNDGLFRAGQRHTYTLRGLFDQKDGTERYMLIPQDLDFQQSFMVTLVKGSDQKWVGFYTCAYPYDIGRMSVECETTCIGCLEDQPNQLAHMDYGGCLYAAID